jgi:hypothetical protein
MPQGHRLTHESVWKGRAHRENSRERMEVATRTDQACEGVTRDIEKLEEWAAERPAESKSSTSEG